jgi:molybdopterin synthase sulfur carrier subunit
MAEVKVKLFANMCEATGVSEILLSGEKVINVLLSLTKKYPVLKYLILENVDEKSGTFDICGSVNVLINGNNVRHLEGLDTFLVDLDEIVVLSPVSGG